ncbi:MAG: hypothetical protein ACK4M7_05060, partial [Burkholderiales bacterium]
SKSWFTNIELICFLRYYGLDFVEYEPQKDGVILGFLDKEYKEFFLHSDATLNGAEFMENCQGTHWQLLIMEENEKAINILFPNTKGDLTKVSPSLISFSSSITVKSQAKNKQDEEHHLSYKNEKEDHPLTQSNSVAKPEDNFIVKLASEFAKVNITSSYKNISVAQLINKLKTLISTSHSLNLTPDFKLRLQQDLTDIKFYLHNPAYVTGAAAKGGLVSLRHQYGAKLLRIGLMLNSKMHELTESDSDKAYKGIGLLVKSYKIKRAYLDIYQGKKFQKAGLSKANQQPLLSQVNPIKVQSKYNIQRLIEELKLTAAENEFGLRQDELQLFEVLLNLPYKLQHATNSYYPILNAGRLDSYKELKRKDNIYTSPYSTKGNVDKLANDGFVFFRLYVEPINSSQTRYGDTSLIFDVDLLFQQGWISLHDQLKPFSTPGASRYYHKKRLIRTAEVVKINNQTKDVALNDGLSYTYRKSPIKSYGGKKDTQKSFGSSIEVFEKTRSFLEEIFYGPDILVGIALSLVRELRYLEASEFRQYFLTNFAKASKAEQIQSLGELIKDSFRIEGKYPVALGLQANGTDNRQYYAPIVEENGLFAQQFQVINADGDGRYTPDASINKEAMALGKLRAEQKVLEENRSNFSRQKKKFASSPSKVAECTARLQAIANRLSEIETALAKDTQHR